MHEREREREKKKSINIKMSVSDFECLSLNPRPIHPTNYRPLITRAKSFQYVLKSVSDEKLKDDSLLNHYFRFIKEFSHVDEDNESHDRFQQEVVKALHKAGFDDVKCGYPLAGSLLDILVQHKERYYFIDLVGYPGVFEDAFSLERYKTLARTGIKSFPLHYTLWQKNKKEVMYRLKVFLR